LGPIAHVFFIGHLPREPLIPATGARSPFGFLYRKKLMLMSQDLRFANELIQKKLDEGSDIRPFPRSVNRLIAALKDPDSSSDALAQLIEADAGLAVRLLRMANSPMFGVTQELTSIRQAVTMLGRRPLKNLAFAYACSTLFSDTSGSVSHREAIWNHSLGCAITAKLIANAVPTLSTDDAFLSGLLHDVGKLFLLSGFSKEYGKHVASKWGNELLQLEQELFGCTHAELGFKLIVAWPLRDEVKLAVRHHHTHAGLDSNSKLTQVLSVANILVRSAGIGSCPAPDKSPTESAFQLLGLPERYLWSIQDEAAAMFLEAKQSWAS
jgi:HD-like signal output (HDOD) protein